MNRSQISRTVFVVLTISLLTSTGLPTTAAHAQQQEAVLHSGLLDSIGLVMDHRGYLYTAERSTGSIFCIAPGDTPILYAQVPYTPTALAVDKLRNVFVGTEGGTIFLISLDGSVSEVYRCQTRPMGLDIDRDGNLVIATIDGNIIRVARRDLSWK